MVAACEHKRREKYESISLKLNTKIALDKRKVKSWSNNQIVSNSISQNW